MFDDLLPYYNSELAYLRRLAAEFAEAHPKIAGRLRLSGDAAEDPHVARLLEGVAFLNARIRAKLDDEFPELTDALLGLLYPHYLAPVPSMAVVRFEPPLDAEKPHRLPAGLELESEPVAGDRCRFRTCYPVTLLPVVVDQAVLGGQPLRAPVHPRAGGAMSCLHLTLRCTKPDLKFGALGAEALRFFLRGQAQQVHPLYELIFNNTVGVALADGPDDPEPVLLGPDCLRQVGFEREECVLPSSSRAQFGYRLLTEFFAFPERHLFVDVTGLAGRVKAKAGNRLGLFLYFNRSRPELERTITAENFALNATPVINLFRQRAEPIVVSQTQVEYRVVPDARRPDATEVYDIEAVQATDRDGRTLAVTPFYSTRHAVRGEPTSRMFWHLTRRRPEEREPGTEASLALVDLDFNPLQPADWVLSVDTLCFNRDLPSRLPFGGGHPALRLVVGGPPVRGITCLTPPTPTLRPVPRQGGRWRLISHLALNHLSLTDDREGLDALKEILALYNVRSSAETQAMIDGVTSLTCRRGTARAPARDLGVFCHGIDVSLEFDEKQFSGGGLFLMACVLDRFFGLYCTINSFTRLTATLKGRPGVLRKWPPRAGSRPLF